MLGFAGLMSAQKNGGEDVKVVGSYDEAAKSYVYQWTSTCNVVHTTTFPGSWSGQDIAQWISDTNTRECGVRPRNVFVEIPPNHY